MMTPEMGRKATYELSKGTDLEGGRGKGSRRKPSDSSYRACLCALLAFLALCLIIILAISLRGGDVQSPSPSERPAIKVVGDDVSTQFVTTSSQATRRIYTVATVPQLTESTTNATSRTDSPLKVTTIIMLPRTTTPVPTKDTPKTTVPVTSPEYLHTTPLVAESATTSSPTPQQLTEFATSVDVTTENISVVTTKQTPYLETSRTRTTSSELSESIATTINPKDLIRSMTELTTDTIINSEGITTEIPSSTSELDTAITEATEETAIAKSSTTPRIVETVMTYYDSSTDTTHPTSVPSTAGTPTSARERTESTTPLITPGDTSSVMAKTTATDMAVVTTATTADTVTTGTSAAIPETTAYTAETTTLKDMTTVTPEVRTEITTTHPPTFTPEATTATTTTKYTVHLIPELTTESTATPPPTFTPESTNATTTSKDIITSTSILTTKTPTTYAPPFFPESTTTTTSPETTTESITTLGSTAKATDTQTSIPDVNGTSAVTLTPERTTELPTVTAYTSETATTATESICETSDCASIASWMLAKIDHSVNPCEDFYSYACGRLQTNDYLLAEDPDADVRRRLRDALNSIDRYSPIALQKARRFYDSCVSYDEDLQKAGRINKVRIALDKMGTFHTKESWNKADEPLKNMTTLLVKLFKHHSSTLFDVMLDVDGRNSSRFAIKLTIPNHQLHFTQSSATDACRLEYTSLKGDVNLTDVYENYAYCLDSNVSQMLSKLEEVLHEVGVFSRHVRNSTERATYISDIRFITDLLLQSIYSHKVDRRIIRSDLISKKYEEVTIDQLQTDIPQVKWSYLFSSLVPVGFQPDERIQLYFGSYFRTIFRSRELKYNYNLNNVLLGLYALDLYEELVEPQGKGYREEYCLDVTRKFMDDVMSVMYLRTFDKSELEELQAVLDNTFNNLKDTLIKNIQESSWFEDDASKTEALQKASDMTADTDGGISYFLSDTFLKSGLDDLRMGNTFFENMMSLRMRYRKRMYSLKEKNPSDKISIFSNRWSQFSLPMNIQPANVIYGLNKIVVPFSTMVLPFYDKKWHMYLKMGGLGSVLAHEMMHGFDQVGVTYGPDGRKVTSPSRLKEDIRTMGHCYADEWIYARRTTTAVKGRSFTFKLSPFLSVNERMADSGGLKLAWDSYIQHKEYEKLLPWLSSKEMSKEQLFFLTHAQIHCSKMDLLQDAIDLRNSEHTSPQIRVNSFASNSAEFSAAFHCSRNNTVSAPKKCGIFPSIVAEDTLTSSSETPVY